MKISELIATLTEEQQRLGDRELLEGVAFGEHRPFSVDYLLNGDHLGHPGKAVMFLRPKPQCATADVA